MLKQKLIPDSPQLPEYHCQDKIINLNRNVSSENLRFSAGECIAPACAAIIDVAETWGSLPDGKPD
jgi:hypothetical protein